MVLCEKCGYTTEVEAVFYFGECPICHKNYAVANPEARRDENGVWFIPDGPPPVRI
jgi:hypothetical protein